MKAYFQAAARRSVASLLSCILLAAAAVSFAPAGAAANPVSTEHVEARLLSEVTAISSSGGTFWVALEQNIIPGWHTYWRNPGDSGEPTKIVWTLPDGFTAGDIEWPAPERLPYGPLVNFGYKDRVVFPIEMTAPAGLEPGNDVTFKAEVYWLVCEDICIPQDVAITFTLPVAQEGFTRGTLDRRAIEAARASLPVKAPQEAVHDRGADSTGLRIALIGEGFDAAIEQGSLESAVIFPYEDGIIDNAAPQTVSYGPRGLTVGLKPGFLYTQKGMSPPQVIDGIIVLTETIEGEEQRRALEFSAPAGPVPAGAAAAAMGGGSVAGAAPGLALLPQDLGLLQAVLFALLGGLILNLMPCVFPVIFLKALGFVSKAKEAPGTVRLHGLAYTGGVVLSFAALGALLFALRASGSEVGWGFHLQSPLVVTLLTYLLFAIGLNLSGVFEIGTSVQGVGGSLAESKGYSGSFFTGVLATVVATPCVAPFMAAALGLALTLPPAGGMVIFIALGIGMAIPYLVLSLAPSLVTLLPKPGMWMERMKQALAFPLYLTCVWLFWVLAQQNVGPFGLGFVLVGLVLIAFAGWIFGVRAGLASTGWRAANALIAVAAFAGALYLAARLEPMTGSVQTQDGSQAALPYEAYSEARLAELRGEGRAVFVNFTAAWCITCLVNERVALSTPQVASVFETQGIAYLKGDWTNRDPEITRALSAFGRAGVPLYLYYPPAEQGDNGEPAVLPQILTPGVVLDVITAPGTDS